MWVVGGLFCFFTDDSICSISTGKLFVRKCSIGFVSQKDLFWCAVCITRKGKASTELNVWFVLEQLCYGKAKWLESHGRHRSWKEINLFLSFDIKCRITL